MQPGRTRASNKAAWCEAPDIVIRFRCDGCGSDLKRDGSNHFILKIEVYAAAGKLEFTEEDLRRDHRTEMETVIRDLARVSPDEIEDQVYRAFRFDLCPPCHRAFLAAPLAALKPRGLS